MNEKQKTTISKFMSLVLRHNPNAAELTLDSNGWANVDDLLKGISVRKNTKVTFGELEEIVATNNKKRFQFSDDFTKIRAVQGHSVSVDVELTEAVPPAVLYHGTASKNLQSIYSKGLHPRSRLHVHLSAEIETAVQVGKRHGNPVVLEIDTAKMRKDGYKFYLADNGVWLADSVPAAYLGSCNNKMCVSHNHNQIYLDK